MRSLSRFAVPAMMKLFAGRDVGACEEVESLLGVFAFSIPTLRSVWWRVHGGFSKLLGIHLAQPLVPLDRPL